MENWLVRSRFAPRLLTVAAVLLMLCEGSFAGSCERWVQASGPYGGGIWTIAVDPTTPSTIYAGGLGAWLYRTTDGGANWTTLKRGPNEGVASLAIDPETPSVVYVASGAAVYRSTDRGEHWSATTTGLSGYPSCLAIDPSNPSRLFTSTNLGLYRTTDRGEHWTLASNGLAGSVYTVALDRTNPSRLYAGTMEGKIFRSTDAGDHWIAASSGSPGSLVFALAVDPVSPSTVYAGTMGTGVYRSTDSGDHWTVVNTELSNIRSLVFDPVTPGALYAGSRGGGVHWSSDQGVHWTPRNTGLMSPSVFSLAIDPGSPSGLYAATYSGIFRSTNRGASWAEIDNGLISHDIWALAVDSKNPAKVYAGTGAGVFRSTDAGRSWPSNLASLREREIYGLTVHPTNSSIIYAATDAGLYASTDGGGTWTPNSPGTLGEYMSSIVFDPTSPSTLYASNYSTGVYRSTNGGTNWVAINNGLPANPSVNRLAIDPVTPSKLYVAMFGGVYRTTDRGDHWVLTDTGANSRSEAIAVDPGTPSTVYVGTLGRGLFRSTDSGVSWVNLGFRNKDIRAIEVDPSGSGVVLVGTFESGVYRSTDRGASWMPVSKGLVRDETMALAIDPVTQSRLYAGTSGAGLYVLDAAPCELPFPQFGNGGGFASDIVLINPSFTTSASPVISAAADGGLALPVVLSGGAPGAVIPPQGALTLSTDGKGALLVGSALATSDSPLGGVVRFSIPGIGIAGVGASAQLKRFIAPVRRTAAGIDTGIAFWNPEPFPVSLRLTLRNEQGQSVDSGRVENLPPGGHLARFITELFPVMKTPAYPATFAGTLTVEGEDGQIAAAVLELGPAAGQFTTLPVTPLYPAGTLGDLLFAQFGSGDGFTSETVLVNPNLYDPVSGTLTFLDDQGQPMSVGLTGSGQKSSQTFTVPSHGAVTISTDGAGPVKIGSARVTADGPLAGVVRFQIPGTGIAGVGASQPSGRLLIPVRRNSAGINTGVAVFNPADQAVTVTLKLRNTAGAEIAGGTSIVNLPARGHRAQFIQELFPQASTQDFQGTVSIEVTGGPVAATALELGSKPGEFTTLPAAPVQ